MVADPTLFMVLFDGATSFLIGLFSDKYSGLPDFMIVADQHD